MIEEVGFRYLARHEDDVWRDGRWWNQLRYELTAREWASKPASSDIEAPGRQDARG